ncbi:MAG TPA: response regulator [Acidimicrobiales bacterium]|nr:response regulator [Acidimicrobiales bacterium]
MAPHASVLLVDDDEDLRHLLRVALAKSDVLDVIGDAGDGESALRLAAEMRPDIVVLDLGLPDIAGREVLTRLRELHPDVRVVIFTGDEDAGRSALVSEAAAGVVVKGERLSRLLNVLEDVAGQSGDVATVDLSQDPASVGQARRFTRERLERWGAGALVESSVLVVSELVTNAITHAGSVCRVVLRRNTSTGSVRIEVTDFGAGSPEPQPPSPIRPNGRGLLIVSSLATAWGIDPSTNGKIVWAEIAA